MVVYSICLLRFHVQADRNESFSEESGIPAGSFTSLWDRVKAGPNALTTIDKILFGALILMAFELLDYISGHVGKWINAKLIPVRGKHLDELSGKDILFVGLNKAATAPFVYIVLRYAYFEPNVVWSVKEMSLMNTVLPLPVLYIVFDLFYTVIHWALHIKAIYGYIHKHHHHQKAPSRANVDAVNVHPIEFFLGEYDHLLSLFLVCNLFGMQVHIVAAIFFLAFGGLLAGLNHTRFDVCFSLFGIKLYDSKAHDVHHRIPQSNYGQYMMLWDYIFGSYRPYNPNDRVNPKAQLDPTTGKSIEYTEAKKLATKQGKLQ
jgi:sterol desaturase/sphingolipid hydroxylase (fatty acid hydroxylase superfamily)